LPGFWRLYPGITCPLDHWEFARFPAPIKEQLTENWQIQNCLPEYGQRNPDSGADNLADMEFKGNAWI